jgi:hypothetical protein
MNGDARQARDRLQTATFFPAQAERDRSGRIRMKAGALMSAVQAVNESLPETGAIRGTATV